MAFPYAETLVVLPGSRIFFLSGRIPPIRLEVENLIAQGLDDNAGSIVFTSSGDTIGGSPMQGDWGRIRIGDSPSPVKHCFFKYGEVGAEFIGVVFAESCSFENNKVGVALFNCSGPCLQCIKFKNNETGLLVGTTLPSPPHTTNVAMDLALPEILSCSFQNCATGIFNAAGYLLEIDSCSFVGDSVGIETFDSGFPGFPGTLLIRECYFQALGNNRYGIKFDLNSGGEVKKSRFENNGGVGSLYSAIIGYGGTGGPSSASLNLGMSPQDSGKNVFIGFDGSQGDFAIENQYDQDTIYAIYNYWDSTDSLLISQQMMGNPVVFYPFLTDTPTSVAEDGISGRLPRVFDMIRNYPNPFNNATSIIFESRSKKYPNEISFDIFDLLGKRVNSLKLRSTRMGRYEGIWDGNDLRGFPVASGFYLGRARGSQQVLKMVIIK